MSENRFTIWHMFGLLIIAASVAILFLGGGLFFGYQVGRSSTLATSVANQANGTTSPLAQNTISVPQQVNVSGPYLGIEFQTLDSEVAQEENLPVSAGALIRNVMPNSPADQAGLQPGDIVQRVNDQDLNGDLSLRDLVHRHKPGETLTLIVWRAGQTATYTITLKTVPSGFDFSSPTSTLTPAFQLQCVPGPCEIDPTSSLP